MSLGVKVLDMVQLECVSLTDMLEITGVRERSQHNARVLQH